MKLGIIGLPQAGKTTIFNALTGSNHPTGQMSSGRRFEVKTAVIDVPDPRIDTLGAMYNRRKTIYAKVTYTDIAGVELGGGAQGFSGPLRNELAKMDGLLHVVRAFANDNVPHVSNSVDPQRDVAAVEGEFLINDLIAVENRLEKLGDELRKGGGRDKLLIKREIALFERLKSALEEELPLRELELTAQDEMTIAGFGFFSRMPVLVVFNTGDEAAVAAEWLPANFERHQHMHAVALRGQIEMEIAQLSQEDAGIFLEEYEIEEPSRRRIIKLSYDLLNLQSFFTVGDDEVRAWAVAIGASAPVAAGKVHTDLQKGFIRAEVMAYDDLNTLGSEAKVKAAGKWRLEGKGYVVQDGDILNIRFSPPAKK